MCVYVCVCVCVCACMRERQRDIEDKTCACHPAVSMDYGKSFRDVSHRIDHTFIRKEFGVTTGPGNSFHVSISHLSEFACGCV